MIKLTKKHLYKRAEIYFDDHSIRVGTVIKCMAFGYIHAITRKQIKVRWWDILSDDKALIENNIEVYNIARSAITDIKFI